MTWCRDIGDVCVRKGMLHHILNARWMIPRNRPRNLGPNMVIGRLIMVSFVFVMWVLAR
jgi:hypothetical protein